MSLGDHLVDAFLYRYRWEDKARDGIGRPNWSRWTKNTSDPADRDLVPVDRNAPIPAAIRDFLVKTPADSDETKTIGGLPVRGILQPYRGTPRLLENPRPNDKINR